MYVCEQITAHIYCSTELKFGTDLLFGTRANAVESPNFTFIVHHMHNILGGLKHIRSNLGHKYVNSGQNRYRHSNSYHIYLSDFIFKFPTSIICTPMLFGAKYIRKISLTIFDTIDSDSDIAPIYIYIFVRFHAYFLPNVYVY